MHSERTDRGFVRVLEERYPPEHPLDDASYDPLIQESSSVGTYKDSLAKPGSSYLWVGDNHHLNREQVRELIKRMNHWLKTGRLALDEETNLGN